MSKPQVIGQGSYGCVHNPSLKCKDKKIISNYNDKISKIMKDEHAQTEMQEYVGINKIDPDNKYHLKPEKCVPDYSYEMKETVMKCKIGKDIIKEKDKYKLIVMKYGGPDLKQFFKKPMEDTPKNRERISDFWIEAIDLFKAIKLFIKNGMIHHDLKPENIVYDENNHSVKIIDFGLLQKKNDIIEKSKDSDYWLSQFHFNFPPELFFYNKEIWDDVDEDSFDSIAKKEFFSSVDIFMTYVKSEGLHPQLNAEMKRDFLDFVEIRQKLYTHDKFLNDSINTIDVYGLGLSLLYILTRVNELMKPTIIKKLYNLFMEMVNSDIRFRIDIDKALLKYESIIQDLPKRKITDEKESQNPPSPSNIQNSSFTSSELHFLSMSPPDIKTKSPSLSKIPIPSFESSTRKSRKSKSKSRKSRK